jgi:hypothetical protein
MPACAAPTAFATMPERPADLYEQARAFQESLAQRLSELPFAQLCGLPERSDINSPAELRGLYFSVLRHGPKRDRVWIEVIETVPDQHATSAAAVVKELEARHSVWFEKHPDGNVTWPRNARSP